MTKLNVPMAEGEAQAQAHMDAVSTRIREILADCPRVMRPMTEHLAQAPGKMVRAALTFAVTDALGKPFTDATTDLAAATEILHLSTLIHDDIIDDAKTRRGINSLQYQFGKKLAVLSGDYLFTKCFRLMAGRGAERTEDFAKAVSAICAGEILQYQNNRNTDLTYAQYCKIISGKTAAMFAMAAYAAAVDCGADKLTAERMGRAGYNMGMAFQIVDDLLDFTGDADKIRKGTHKDLEQGIITYPLIFAIAKQLDIKKRLRKKRLTEQDAEAIVAAVQSSGGLEAARAKAKMYRERALNKIRKITGGDLSRAGWMLAIMDSMINREC